MRLISFIFIISIIALTAISANAMDDNSAKEGISLAFKLGQEYNEISKHSGSHTNYNALVDQWNAFVAANFGNDPSMIMTKTNEKTANLQKPYVLGKNLTSNGIVHSIDGSNKGSASYTTNDMNLIPARDAADMDRTTGTYPDGSPIGGQYLGGV